MKQILKVVVCVAAMSAAISAHASSRHTAKCTVTQSNPVTGEAQMQKLLRFDSSRPGPQIITVAGNTTLFLSVIDGGAAAPVDRAIIEAKSVYGNSTAIGMLANGTGVLGFSSETASGSLRVFCQIANLN